MKKVLIISHMANIPGCCQAEWIDDRIFELLKRDYHISVISGSHCFKYNENIHHYRIPSILPYEAKAELNEIESMKIDIDSRTGTMFYLKIMRQVSNSLAFLKLSLFKGEGRWFWMFSSLFVGLRIMLFQKFDFIYTSGGPASAHLTGILLSKLFRCKLLVELQDPLTGEDIGRNQLTIKGLEQVEKFIVKNSNHIVFATKNACVSAKDRYPKQSARIDYIYPGAKKNPVGCKEEVLKMNSKLNFSYIGSLYQTRNLDNFFKALEEISISVPYEINLYGWVAEDILARIKKINNNNIKIHGMISRQQAIEKAQIADVLLLVQHTDLRSKKTIPFKIYDYLNSENLIFGLTYQNEEINHLLDTHGHITSNAGDVKDIQKKLKLIFKSFQTLKTQIKISKLTPEVAVNKMERIVHYV